jgi:outer membrane cobalamin receptor
VVFPSVQGASFYQTAVLINGIPLNDLANGLGNLGQIPSELIECIEVIHGAGGVEWGSALGGVINIITKKPKSINMNSALGGGSDYSIGFASTNLQYILDKVQFAIGAETRKIFTNHEPDKNPSPDQCHISKSSRLEFNPSVMNELIIIFDQNFFAYICCNKGVGVRPYSWTDRLKN